MWTFSSKSTGLWHCIKFADKYKEKKTKKSKKTPNQQKKPLFFYISCNTPGTGGRTLESICTVAFEKQSWSQLWGSDLAFFFFFLIPNRIIQLFCFPAQFTIFVRQAQMTEDVHPSQSLDSQVFRRNPMGLLGQLFPQAFPSVFSFLPSFRVRQEISNNNPKFWSPKGM